MAKIFPFRAYRYASEAGPPQNLVAQPYDKITPEMQARYYEAGPYNFARIIKGKTEPSDGDSNNVYTRAASNLNDWIARGVLEQEAEEAFYPYFQEFRHPDSGETFVRKGFIGLTQLEDYSAGVIHRHEMTHSGPKLDRLRLIRHTRAHVGQLFMLYDDPSPRIDRRLDEAASGAPLSSVEDEYGVRHTVWKVTDPSSIGELQQLMDPKKLLIADGHHRYETALAYSRENPTLGGADRAMMTFVNMQAAGLVVLATHRVLEGLRDFDPQAIVARAGEFFDSEALASPAELRRRLDSAGHGGVAFGAVFRSARRAYLFRPKREALDRLLDGLSRKERNLDVVVLHKVFLETVLGISAEEVKELKYIRYVRGFDAAAEEVASDRAQAALLLRPVPVRQVAEIAFSGGVMPQKSTDFYPKLLSGLTIYRIE